MYSAILFAVRNWKLALAGLGVLGVLLFGVTAYTKGRLDASHAAKVREYQATIANLQKAAEIAKHAYMVDAAQAKADADKIQQYEDRESELLSKLKDADRECLSSSDTDSLRDLWK